MTARKPGLLTSGDSQGGGIVAVGDQLAEAGRAGDVGALADVDEEGAGHEVTTPEVSERGRWDRQGQTG